MSESDIVSYSISVFQSRAEMGKAAGRTIEQKIIELLKDKSEIRMVFAAAPSQTELLDYLSSSILIEWNKIVAFHMDEYIGLSSESPESFANYLNQHIFKKVPFKKVHLINGVNQLDKELERYTNLLSAAPIDIICLGIGENGHIAFNDPDVADFNDPKIVKAVRLDQQCRQQQVNDGCFAVFSDVPQKAITLTIPTLMSAKFICCVVPGSSKREAVKNSLFGPIDSACPASILRTHPSCKFFFDTESYNK